MLQVFIPPEKSQKNLIVNLLLQNRAMDVNSLRKHIKRNYGISATYQGINKTLKLLMDDKIVLKTNKGWILNDSWMSSTINSFKTYLSNEIPVYTKDMKSVTFGTINKALNFILKNVETGALKNGGDDIYIAHAKNLGFYSLDRDQIRLMKKLGKSNECHILVEQDNYVNRVSAHFFKKAGVNVYLGIPRSTPYVTNIFGNTIVNVLSTNLLDFLNDTYQKIKSMASMKTFDVHYGIKDDPKFKIKMTFETDLEIVADTKDYLLKLAKTGKKMK